MKKIDLAGSTIDLGQNADWISIWQYGRDGWTCRDTFIHTVVIYRIRQNHTISFDSFIKRIYKYFHLQQ